MLYSKFTQGQPAAKKNSTKSKTNIQQTKKTAKPKNRVAEKIDGKGMNMNSAQRGYLLYRG